MQADRRDLHFGYLGQVYDPWVWLGWIAGHTTSIALATGSIILPLRHPVHTAKAVRLGVSALRHAPCARCRLWRPSGGVPAFNVDADRRGVLFRGNLALIRRVLMEEFPRTRSS